MDIIDGHCNKKGWELNPEKQITLEALNTWIAQYKIGDDPWVYFFRKILSINFPPGFFLVMPWTFDESASRFWIRIVYSSPFVIFVPDEKDWGTARIIYNIPPSWNMNTLTEDFLRKGIIGTLNEERKKAVVTMIEAQRLLAETTMFSSRSSSIPSIPSEYDKH